MTALAGTAKVAPAPVKVGAVMQGLEL